ncbi:MAG: hypothetical protein K2X03_31215 [Bryobacteraceae bacterium]|nr:hypothetical protein [Bryobacteraceae bacterium]
MRPAAAPAAKGPSRGPFFDMMLAASPATTSAPAASPLARTGNSGAKIRSSDDFSPLRGGGHPSAGRGGAIQAREADPAPPEPPTPPPAQTPVETINALLTKLGFDASKFNARVTSETISVPGMSYQYPLLEVTVNGERVGFHLPSAMKDPRMTAANISSMLGKPVMDLSVFA